MMMMGRATASIIGMVEQGGLQHTGLAATFAGSTANTFVLRLLVSFVVVVVVLVVVMFGQSSTSPSPSPSPVPPPFHPLYLRTFSIRSNPLLLLPIGKIKGAPPLPRQQPMRKKLSGWEHL